jgi:hypothetical protein
MNDVSHKQRIELSTFLVQCIQYLEVFDLTQCDTSYLQLTSFLPRDSFFEPFNGQLIIRGNQFYDFKNYKNLTNVRFLMDDSTKGTTHDDLVDLYEWAAKVGKHLHIIWSVRTDEKDITRLGIINNKSEMSKLKTFRLDVTIPNAAMKMRYANAIKHACNLFFRSDGSTVYPESVPVETWMSTTHAVFFLDQRYLPTVKYNVHLPKLQHLTLLSDNDTKEPTTEQWNILSQIFVQWNSNKLEINTNNVTKQHIEKLNVFSPQKNYSISVPIPNVKTYKM